MREAFRRKAGLWPLFSHPDPTLSLAEGFPTAKGNTLPPSPQKMNHGASSNTFPSIMLVLWQLISWTKISCLHGKTFQEFRIYVGITGAIGIWTSFMHKLDNIKLYLPSVRHPDPKVFFFSSKRDNKGVKNILLLESDAAALTKMCVIVSVIVKESIVKESKEGWSGFV